MRKYTYTDLVGKVFGNWTVISRRGSDKHHNILWLCECVCGIEKEVRGNGLVSGKSTSCGCSYKTDLTGKRFGKLVVVREDLTQKPDRCWVCQCDCGNTKTIIGSSLKQGVSNSCGCSKGEWIRQSKITHGLSSSLAYKMWQQAKLRANRKNILFDLHPSDIHIPEFCPLLGIPLVAGEKKHHANSPSLDRLRPELGYIKGNIAVISYRANSIKQDATPEELKSLAGKLEEILNGALVHKC